MDSEVQSRAAKAMSRCAQHVAAVRGQAAAVPSIAARGCRGAR